MAKRRLSQEDRREQIIQVAISLFARKGFKGATTRAIAKAAGVSEAIIFRHFATKEDLYNAIIEHTVQKRSDLWQREGPSQVAPSDVRAHLEEFARSFIRRNREDPTFIRLMMYSALEDHQFRERFFEIYRSPHLRAVREAIEQGIGQGQFRPVDPGLTVRCFLWSLLHYCISAFIARRSPGDPASDSRMVDNLVALFLDGIALPGESLPEH